MGRKFDIDHSIDYALLLLNKETGAKEGRVLAYYTAGGTCYAYVEFYTGNTFNGEWTSGDGSASGYGYDKMSSAIADALQHANVELGDMAIRASAAGHTGSKFTTPDAIDAEAKRQHAIPVYRATGNQETAFAVWWHVEKVV